MQAPRRIGASFIVFLSLSEHTRAQGLGDTFGDIGRGIQATAILSNDTAVRGARVAAGELVGLAGKGIETAKAWRNGNGDKRALETAKLGTVLLIGGLAPTGVGIPAIGTLMLLDVSVEPTANYLYDSYIVQPRERRAAEKQLNEYFVNQDIALNSRRDTRDRQMREYMALFVGGSATFTTVGQGNFMKVERVEVPSEGIRFVGMYQRAGQNMVYTAVPDVPCSPIYSDVKEEIRNMRGQYGDNCRVTGQKETDRTIITLAECQGIFNNRPRLFRSMRELQISETGGAEIIFYDDAFTGRMELKSKEVFEACVFVEPDCSEEGQENWRKEHGSDKINYECEVDNLSDSVSQSGGSTIIDQ